MVPDPLRSLQLAFAYHTAVELVSVDAAVDPSEIAWLEERFPQSDLLACGLVSADGSLSADFRETVRRARTELPKRLTLGEKLALVELVAEAVAADGLLVPEEADALAAVARRLGVDDGQWLDHLEGLITAGRLQRDDAGV